MVCDDLEGWDREDGREAQDGGDIGDICMPMADSLWCTTSQYCEAIILQ